MLYFVNPILRYANILLITFITFAMECNYAFAHSHNSKSLQKSKNVWTTGYYFIDTTGTIAFEEVLSGKFDKEFKAGQDKQNTFGFTKSAIWLKFNVDRKEQDRLVVIERVSLFDAVLYTTIGKRVIHIDSIGVNIPYYKRPYISPYCVSQITSTSQDSSITCYLRVSTYSSLFLPIYLDTQEHYQEKVASISLFNGIYIGIFLVVIFFNAFTWVTTRNHIYGWYLLYSISLLAYQGLFNTGIGYKYIWFNMPALNKHAVIFSSILGIAMLLFSIQLLNSKSKLVWYNKIHLILVGAFILMIVLNLSGVIHFTSKYSVWVSLPTFIFLIFLGIRSIEPDNSIPWLYLIGWGFFLLFYALFALWLNGFIGQSELGHRALFIGSIFEMLFWFSAISNHVMRSKKIQAAEEAFIRKEISRDFHDELGNRTARLINEIGLYRIRNEITQTTFSKLNEHAQAILYGARDFVWALDPNSEELGSIIIHIRDFGEKIFKEKEIDFRVDGNLLEKIKLPLGYSRQINLIFKEAMTNIFKHSQASKVLFSYEHKSREIIMSVQDNGIGIPITELENASRGIDNMRARASRINGSLIFETTPTGTLIRLRFHY